MFGMGFSEILVIALVAILFLGPDKLPEAMVQIAKLFNTIRRSVNDAKSAFEEELHLKELKEEVLSYRQSFSEASSDISGFKNAVAKQADELEDALQIARSGMPSNSLNQSLDTLIDDEEEVSTKPPAITEYKQMAQKALKEAQAKDANLAQNGAESADEAKKDRSDSPRPTEFKHLKQEAEL